MSGSTATAPVTSCFIFLHYSGVDRGWRGGEREKEGKQRQKRLYLSVFFSPIDLQDQLLKPRGTSLFWFQLAPGERALVGQPWADTHDKQTQMRVKTDVGSFNQNCGIQWPCSTLSVAPCHPVPCRALPVPLTLSDPHVTVCQAARLPRVHWSHMGHSGMPLVRLHMLLFCINSTTAAFIFIYWWPNWWIESVLKLVTTFWSQITEKCITGSDLWFEFIWNMTKVTAPSGIISKLYLKVSV